MQTKAKIDLKAGVIELEGSEEFVRAHIEKFSSLLHYPVPHSPKPEPSSTTTSPPEHPLAEATTAIPAARKSSTPKVSKTPTKTKRIEPTRFDIHTNGSIVSLEEFLQAKKPKSAGDVIAVIGYYLTQMKGEATFSEGNIDYAYRTLQLKGRPKHLRQIIINNKNQKDLFESADEDGHWVLTRAGEIYVDEKLPAKEE